MRTRVINPIAMLLCGSSFLAIGARAQTPERLTRELVDLQLQREKLRQTQLGLDAGRLVYWPRLSGNTVVFERLDRDTLRTRLNTDVAAGLLTPAGATELTSLAQRFAAAARESLTIEAEILTAREAAKRNQLAIAKGDQPSPAPTPGVSQGIDVTGMWLDDTGGGAVYRVRQIGNQFYWIVDGTSKGSYVNMAFGTISGGVMTGQWVDLPGSPTLQNGRLDLRIESNDRMVKLPSSGHYAAQVWTRQGSTIAAVPPPPPPPPPPPDRGRLTLKVRLNGSTAIVDWANHPTTPDASRAWVSIVPAGTPDGSHAGRWTYTQNTPSGSYENGPLTPGAWEARFYADGGYGALVERVRFDIGAAAALRVVAQSQIMQVQTDERGRAALTWSKAPNLGWAWVSVVPVGTPETAHVGWWGYTQGTATGRIDVGPLSPGDYEARFYGDQGYGRIIDRMRFKIP